MKTKTKFIISTALLLIFLALTVCVKVIDVRPIGPNGSSVGLATVNGFFFDLLGTSPALYIITEILGGIALICALGFAVLGAAQLIARRSLLRVDSEILLLGALYILLALAYLLFEVIEINFRPVLTDGVLEASYPSSHTLLVCVIIPSAAIAASRMLKELRGLILAIDAVSVIICILTVLGRLASGVHWFTDVLAGVILSAALVMLYFTALSHLDKKREG